MSVDVAPGDLLLTRSKGLAGMLIRFGALLGGQLEAWNHVVIAHHVDDAGTFWGIEGRPGGVGWVNIAKYRDDPRTITNRGQPKSVTQRAQVCDAAEGLLGVEYDWEAIGMDAVTAGRINFAWKHIGPEGPPAHVVCSSLADWVYQQAGLANPGKVPWQLTTPADWADLIVDRGWQR